MNTHINLKTLFKHKAIGLVFAVLFAALVLTGCTGKLSNLDSQDLKAQTPVIPIIGTVFPITATAEVAETFTATVTDPNNIITSCFFRITLIDRTINENATYSKEGGIVYRIYTFLNPGTFNTRFVCTDNTGGGYAGAPVNVEVRLSSVVCGNGVVEGSEQCDDGNLINGDGCSNICTDEECGNAHLDPGEQCDDGNTNPGDGCKNDCTQNVCGDGVIETGVEQCDDGNQIDEDGCSSGCEVEVPSEGSDYDGDGVSSDHGADTVDNCPLVPNPDQKDTDGDGAGDACDTDDDGDGVNDPISPSDHGGDNCPLDANADQKDTDEDGLGDVCDPDDDNDTILDVTDNCHFDENTDQLNNDGDAEGDVCDPDDDNDTIPDVTDNCHFDENTDQLNNDGDAEGDVCDPDDDNDGVLDDSDDCPTIVGLADHNGCPFAEKVNFIESRINQIKSASVCPVSPKTGKPAPSCEVPVADATVRAYKIDADFIALYGGEEYKPILNTIFANPFGFVGECVTGADGSCTIGKPQSGQYLDIVRYMRDDQSYYFSRIVNLKEVKDNNEISDELKNENADHTFKWKNVRVGVLYKNDGTIKIIGLAQLIRFTGSQLDVIYPEYTIWDGTTQVYPFIMTSDDTWTTDICLSVPTGYKVTGVMDQDGNILKTSDCVQSFISGETKIVLFEVTDFESPAPNFGLKLDITHKGKKTRQNLEMKGIRKVDKQKQDEELQNRINGLKKSKGLRGSASENQLSSFKNIIQTASSLWNAVRSQLGAEASNTQVMELTKDICIQNEIAVPEWNIDGKLDSRKLKASFIDSLLQ